MQISKQIIDLKILFKSTFVLNFNYLDKSIENDVYDAQENHSNKYLFK